MESVSRSPRYLLMPIENLFNAQQQVTVFFERRQTQKRHQQFTSQTFHDGVRFDLCEVSEFMILQGELDDGEGLGAPVYVSCPRFFFFFAQQTSTAECYVL